MAEHVTAAELNAQLLGMTPSEIVAFRAQLDPTLFDELYRAGLEPQAQALFLSDPQWGLLTAGLTKLVVLAFVIERSLAFVFEHSLYVNAERFFHMRPSGPELAGGGVAGSTVQTDVRHGFKSFVSLAVALVLCVSFDFNLMTGIFPSANHNYWGMVLTAFIVAGGSQGAITLMQSVLGIRASTRKSMQLAKEAEASAARETAAAIELEAIAKKQNIMNELIGLSIKKLLADRGKTVADLATAIAKTEAEVEKILTGTIPVGEPDKPKIATLLGVDSKKLFGN